MIYILIGCLCVALFVACWNLNAYRLQARDSREEATQMRQQNAEYWRVLQTIRVDIGDDRFSRLWNAAERGRR